MARLGNKYLADTEPWKVIKTDPERVKTIMNISLQIAANLAVVFEPFMPFTSEKLLKMLNLGKPGWDMLGRADILAAGHTLGEPSLLFDKIEDDAIEKQLEKLANTKKANEIKATPVAPQREAVSYDDFSKMDIRVGTILEAERVPKTDKLLKLTIDTGIDKRTVVSGIAGYFTPEQAVGKKVSMLVNLEPRKIRGIESHGMILMAQDADGRLEFVAPLTDVRNGSEVK